MVIRLRPHHLLCVLGWQGHGYDQAFTDNFNLIIAKLKAGESVRLVTGNDDLCAACPRAETTDCQHESADGIDGRVLERLEINVGNTYEIGPLLDQVKVKVAPTDVDEICRGCSWLQYGWCAAALDRDGPVDDYCQQHSW